jgi:hypothetical protein
MKAFMLPALACTLVAGCYTYGPIGSADAVTPAPGTPVEVRLTTAGATALASQVGPDILLLQGQVVSADAAGLTLAVSHTETTRRITSEWKGEHVTLPREDIATVQGRRFSLGQTAVLGGLAGGGLVAAAVLIGGNGSSSTIAGGPPPHGPQ